ncbi:cytochrome P450 [Metabacillus sp. GX 13764]|uniref:cytochrome P450 n=1 Tax=Metabacillus kandeliae TaxID=2900151 RepID=UPI001E32F1B5|nr:cytochrome P450 [Metabacillus kandeliae]MCD7034764.1 cytochrome P450 [Metabacillus kandeliae]
MTELTTLGGPRLLNYLRFRKDPLAFLYETQFVSDIVSVNSSSKTPSYIVHSPEAAREILSAKEGFFRKGSSAKVLGKTLGEGVLTSEEPEHRRQRKLMQPAFHKRQIALYAEAVTRYANGLLSEWKSGEARDISRDMMNLTLNIILKTMFGKDLSKGDSAAITKAVSDVIEKTAETLLSPLELPDSLPTKKNRKYKKGLQSLDELAEKMIQEADPEGDHLLALLLKAQYEDGSSISRDEIRDQILTILIAGHETTSNALSWIWYLLASHPEVQARFYEELNSVAPDRLPSYEDIPKLVYTQQIINESLRLYPAAWIILREAKEEVELAGHLFSKNSIFMISPYAIHRNESLFFHPLLFQPERFAKENKRSLPPFGYLPFGAGSRGCIGSQFAMMEMVLIMAVIGREFEIHLQHANQEAVPEPLVSLRIKGGLKVNPISRKLSR